MVLPRDDDTSFWKEISRSLRDADGNTLETMADQPSASNESATTPFQASLAGRLLHVAWMSIALGLFVEAVVIIVQATWPNSLPAEILGKVTWSVVVCSALAIATAASKASSRAVGLAGLLAAPVAFAVARTVQKTVSGGITGVAAAAPAVAAAPGPWELAIAKGVQYAVFGWLICAAQRKGTLKSHLSVSIPIGVAFAIYLGVRTWSTTEPSAVKPLVLTAKCFGDAAATVGCSVVLWAAAALGSKKSAH